MQFSRVILVPGPGRSFPATRLDIILSKKMISAIKIISCKTEKEVFKIMKDKQMEYKFALRLKSGSDLIETCTVVY